MPKRKQKKYKKPKRPFDRLRIKEEESLIRKYGLKNKKEIWRADSAVGKIRKQAKLLLTKSSEEQDKFIDKLKKQGFAVGSIADVLALDKEDHLKRRLQSILVKKKLSTTPKQARQFIVHKHVTINGNKVNIPSYLVPTDEEDEINLILVKKEKSEDKSGKIKSLVEETKSEGESKENA